MEQHFGNAGSQEPANRAERIQRQLAVVLVALGLAAWACGPSRPSGRGERIDTAGAPARVLPDSLAPKTEPGPRVTVIEASEGRGEELERTIRAELGTTEALLARLRAAARSDRRISTVRARAVTAADPVDGYDIAESSFEILESLGENRIDARHLRLVQTSVDGQLHLDADFLPRPGSEYLLVVQESSASPGAYELVRDQALLGYAFRASDGSFRLATPSTPAVNAAEMSRALYP